MMHKTCSINYGHLADLQKTLPRTDLNKKKKLSFDKISPSDFYFLVGGFGRRPLYDEMGAAARNIHCYTVIGFW